MQRKRICIVTGTRAEYGLLRWVYEIFAAAAPAMIARIPITHLHGGETTEGAFDEAIPNMPRRLEQWRR